jgi:hypothetical protein
MAPDRSITHAPEVRLWPGTKTISRSSTNLDSWIERLPPLSLLMSRPEVIFGLLCLEDLRRRIRISLNPCAWVRWRARACPIEIEVNERCRRDVRQVHKGKYVLVRVVGTFMWGVLSWYDSQGRNVRKSPLPPHLLPQSLCGSTPLMRKDTISLFDNALWGSAGSIAKHTLLQALHRSDAA